MRESSLRVEYGKSLLFCVLLLISDILGVWMDLNVSHVREKYDTMTFFSGKRTDIGQNKLRGWVQCKQNTRNKRRNKNSN